MPSPPGDQLHLTRLHSMQGRASRHNTYTLNHDIRLGRVLPQQIQIFIGPHYGMDAHFPELSSLFWRA